MTAREKYIADHAALFWYTPEAKKKDISDSLLVETILNYGTMDDVKALFNLMGMDKVADVFFAAKSNARSRRHPSPRAPATSKIPASFVSTVPPTAATASFSRRRHNPQR